MKYKEIINEDGAMGSISAGVIGNARSSLFGGEMVKRETTTEEQPIKTFRDYFNDSSTVYNLLDFDKLWEEHFGKG